MPSPASATACRPEASGRASDAAPAAWPDFTAGHTRQADAGRRPARRNAAAPLALLGQLGRLSAVGGAECHPDDPGGHDELERDHRRLAAAAAAGQ